MTKIEFNGKTYERTEKGNWIDKNGQRHPEFQKSLDKLYVESLKTEEFPDDLTVSNMLEEAKKFKNGGSNGYAIKIYESLIDVVNHNQRFGILSELSHCYRDSGLPQKSIDLYERVKVKYGNGAVSSAFCTSLAAACIDIGDYSRAKQFADMAYAKSDGKADGELRGVYGRLKKETTQDR